ncbi:MAG: hypothetical protein O2931_15750 [Planctomycetota bacterium]|nr:hypothetical protein [Planctomycetota bacterium]MDA1180237.1 hypothetical protein [Planctomycetota bacterium]
MTIDSQLHVSTLAQLESLQDQLLLDLESLETRVDRLLRDAQRLMATGRKPNATDAAAATIPTDAKEHGRRRAA